MKWHCPLKMVLCRMLVCFQLTILQKDNVLKTLHLNYVETPNSLGHSVRHGVNRLIKLALLNIIELLTVYY